MIMVALTEFGIAKACRFKPLLWGAAGFWAGALFCVFFTFILKIGALHLLILAVCMISGFVIPGYKLNNSAKIS
jgi:hypothetical protein